MQLNKLFDGRGNEYEGTTGTQGVPGPAGPQGPQGESGTVFQIVRSINHRGYCTEAPENTLPAYRLSRKKGFEYAECDVYMTSDGVPVLLHDATVDRTSDGTGNIREMTLSEAKALDFGSWFSSDFAGEKIPTLEEFLLLCRSLGLHAYLDLRIGHTAAEASRMIGIVKKCGMTGHVTWLGQAAQLTNIKNEDPKARLALTVGDITAEVINNANSLKTAENEVIINCAYSALTDEKVEMCLEGKVPDTTNLLLDAVWKAGYLTASGENTVTERRQLMFGEAYTAEKISVTGGETFIITYNQPVPETTEETPWWAIQEHKADGTFTRTVLQTTEYADNGTYHTYTAEHTVAEDTVSVQISGRTHAWYGSNANNDLTQEEIDARVAAVAPDIFLMRIKGSEAQAVSVSEDGGSIPLEVWTVNSESELIGLNPYVSGVTSDALLAWKVLQENAMG